jgi:F0F1-type ATP synthase assembly protein I
MTTERPELARKIRRAAIVAGLGLVVQLGAAFHWTPATFILSATIGAPLVLLGGALFLAAVWRNMRDKGAL